LAERIGTIKARGRKPGKQKAGKAESRESRKPGKQKAGKAESRETQSHREHRAGKAENREGIRPGITESSENT